MDFLFDAANDSPAWAGQYLSAYISVEGSELTGTTWDPKLVVEYNIEKTYMPTTHADSF